MEQRQQQWEASLRRTSAYEWAVRSLDEIKSLEARIKELKADDVMKSEAGQLATIDMMKKRLDAL